MHLVFVYGTLLRGERYHSLIAPAELVGVAETARGYALYDLGEYPAMVAEGDGVVAGEVYRVTDAILADLDELEDHPELYRRSFIEVTTLRRVQTYLLRPDQVRGLPRIASGSWRTRR